MPDGTLNPLTRHQPGTELENGHTGASKTIDFTARQWASPLVKENDDQHPRETGNRVIRESGNTVQPTPGFSFQPMAFVSSGAGQPVDLDMFLSRLKTHMFSISCMVFQDVWNLDLERVRDCCIHVLSPDGGLIPFCMYNLTDARGRSLYRKT
ncbi:MAG: hypothetical protein JEZ12_23745 [Desulfobacterium sp.]|nr:hypothetical protein [Desulfobacterium sp.]